MADACFGPHAMFSLSAMGLLCLYLMQHTRLARIMLFVIGLLFLFLLDWILGFIFPDRPRVRARA